MTKRISVNRVRSLVSFAFGDSLHVKRVLSLGNATMGVIHAASLSIHAIGHALAQAEGLADKHAIKQVDRLLSNGGIDVWQLFAEWVPYLVGGRTEIVTALDWTDYDADDQSTIALYLVTSHGRATPLLWRTVRKSELKGERNDHEDAVLERLREVLPPGVSVTVLADRGFADTNLFEHLNNLRLDFVIRFRECIYVTNSEGERRKAAEWVPPTGRPLLLRGARVTAHGDPVGAVVCVKARAMKDGWCLATSIASMTGAQIVHLYGRRFTIEEGFRDSKNLKFGMGLSATHIKDPLRRDRLLLVSALATVLLTLLGAAGESLGMDRLLKANTSKTRSHSLLRQGLYYYAAIPMMPVARLRPLMTAFGQALREQSIFSTIFGLV